jgi:hypothetical protein
MKMKQSLAKAIGVNKNMNAGEVKNAWDKAPDSIKSQAPNIATLIATIVTLQVAVKAALSLLSTAQSVYKGAVAAVPGVGAASTSLDTAKTQSADATVKVNDSNDSLINTMDNTEVDVA